MTHRVSRMGFAAACAVATGALLWALPVATAVASSHREAPLITEMPKVDGTNFYMFRGYESGRETYMTFFANWPPLQDSYGGPSYFQLNPAALYEIQIDKMGRQGGHHVSIPVQDTLQNSSVTVGGQSFPLPLINIDPISVSNLQNLNPVGAYTLDVMRESRRSNQKQALLRLRYNKCMQTPDFFSLTA